MGALFVPLNAGVTRIVTAIDIARPPVDIFAYVTTPGNGPKWHPSCLAVEGADDHLLEVGETVIEDFLVAGRRGRVTWRVTTREPFKQWRISGEVDAHPASVVTYTRAPTATGTRFLRELEYRSPNLLFALLNCISLRSRIDAESEQAVRQLKERLEVGTK